jgi:hypothetical protein
MSFKKGDRVRFLNDAGEGVIVSFPSPEEALVEDESGFAYPHLLTELVPVIDWRKEIKSYDEVIPQISDVLDRNIDKDAVKRADKDFKSLYKNREESRKKDWIEVDLHIHELVDRHENMANSEIISIQLEHFERMLRNSEVNKVDRIIFIHGVGQGVLRAEIRKLLNQYYPHCEFLDAPYHIYGYGATEVRIHRQRR